MFKDKVVKSFKNEFIEEFYSDSESELEDEQSSFGTVEQRDEGNNEMKETMAMLQMVLERQRELIDK